jgi:hypothetical protein
MSGHRGGVILLAILFVAGCGAGWSREPATSLGGLDPNQQVQVWVGGVKHRWHGLQINGDSVSGLHYLAPLTCDSCRRSLPVSAVDSIRVGDPPGGFWKSFGAIMGTWLFFGILIYLGGGWGD